MSLESRIPFQVASYVGKRVLLKCDNLQISCECDLTNDGDIKNRTFTTVKSGPFKKLDQLLEVYPEIKATALLLYPELENKPETVENE